MNKTIDVFKLLFSYLVLVMHVPFFTVKFINSSRIIYWIHFLFTNCIARLAVPFFFICSGYLLFKDSNTKSIKPNRIKKYIFRIISLYLVWTVIYLPLIIIDDQYITQLGFLFGIVAYVRDFLITGSYNHLWYLNGLALAVVILYFLHHKKHKIRTILFLAITLYILGLFGCSYGNLLSHLNGENSFLWFFIQICQKIMLTTRNGLFFGFPFVAVGYLIANKKCTINQKDSLILFFISFVAMIIETILITKYDLAIMMDNPLFLLPSSYFLFNVILSINIQVTEDTSLTMRKMSSMIYFSHLLIFESVSFILQNLGIASYSISLVSVFTLIFTTALSIIAVRISKTWQLMSKLF